MKIIFLDYDGVMNPQDTCIVFHKPWDAEFGKEAVKNLNYIIEQTGARVVVSATMRGSHKWTESLFKQNGIPVECYVGFTPYRNSRIRGEEIKTWLDTTIFKVESFVIVDDDNDMLDLKDHLVQTVNQNGLTFENAEKTIKILND